jgi:hypothetical protein
VQFTPEIVDAIKHICRLKPMRAMRRGWTRPVEDTTATKCSELTSMIKDVNTPPAKIGGFHVFVISEASL